MVYFFQMADAHGNGDSKPFIDFPKLMDGIYKWFFKYFYDRYQNEPYTIVAVWGYFFFFWLFFHPGPAAYISTFFLAMMPFVLPFLFWKIMDDSWFEYVRTQKYWSTEHCVLEIRLPEEITQTPFAAELFMRGLYQTGEVDTPLHEFWGNTRPWFSLELVSTEGRVRFFIWTRKRYKNLVEAQMYANYPTVQVVEVPDYTLDMPFDLARMDVWGIEQALQLPDPYPIVTYVELKMDKADTEEQFKNDPLAALIEMMGQLKPGEHIWIQNIIRGHTKPSFGRPGVAPYSITQEYAHHKELNIEQWAKLEIDAIAMRANAYDKEKKTINFIGLSEGDKAKILAIQQKLNKQLFEVGIRAMYVAKREVANSGPRAGIPSAYRSFEHGSEGRGLNGPRPIFWIGPFNYKWQDWWGIRRRMLQRRFYEAYVSRQYFFEPHKHRHIILNTEELATLWHLPGQVVRTPTLERMPSRRGAAPANLPV